MIRPIPMYLWLRWKLGHGEFKPYGRSNPSVRPDVGFGGRGESPVPSRWWSELKARWSTRNPYPLTVDPHALWRAIGYFTAWGWGNGQFVDTEKVRLGIVTAADVRPALLKLKARGAKFVGVQDLVDTRGMRDALKQACRELGLKLVVWEWAKDAQQALGLIDYWRPDGYVANVEHYGPWSELASQVASRHPALSRAVWSNFTGTGATREGTYSVEESKPWIVHDFTLITEAYLCENPSLQPDVLDWTARTHLGYSEVVPSIGIYNGWTVEGYERALASFPNYSVYLAEYLPEFP